MLHTNPAHTYQAATQSTSHNTGRAKDEKELPTTTIPIYPATLLTHRVHSHIDRSIDRYLYISSIYLSVYGGLISNLLPTISVGLTMSSSIDSWTEVRVRLLGLTLSPLRLKSRGRIVLWARRTTCFFSFFSSSCTSLPWILLTVFW